MDKGSKVVICHMSQIHLLWIVGFLEVDLNKDQAGDVEICCYFGPPEAQKQKGLLALEHLVQSENYVHTSRC